MTLAAKHFRRTVDFYEDVFGFEKVSESDIVARFRLKNIFLDIIKSEVLLGRRTSSASVIYQAP